MDGTIIIEEIKKRMKFWGGRFPKATTAFIPNKRGDSWYLIQDRGKGNLPVRIRLSDHGTKLHNWTDREELGDSTSRIDPAYSINISIVFINEGENLTDDCKGQTNCEGCALPVCKPQTFAGQNEIGRPFKVYQYVYQSDTIAPRYINALTKAIFHARYSGEYIDPLKDLPRAAKPKEFDSTNLPKQKRPRYKQTENKQDSKNRNMKRTIRLTENELRHIISESVKTILKENFADNAKTNFAYAKNVVKNNLPPVGMKHPKMAIDSIKFYIKCMEEAIQNKEKCSPRFLFHYRVSMETAEEDGYVKYYKKMKELYNQMVELGLYEDESDINPMSFKDMFGDLKKRVEKRGGYFHG